MPKTPPETVPYDVGYWNGGQRPVAELVAAWRGLLRGDHSPHPLRVLSLSEIGDQDRALRSMESLGFGVIHAPQDVPDGKKEAILYDANAVAPKGEARLIKVGDAFQGKRAGSHNVVRMANKYVLTQEFTDHASGRTPIHGVTHVWPSVDLQSQRVKDMIYGLHEWASIHHGSVFLSLDGNMSPNSRLMAPLRGSDLTCSQLHFGLDGTWGERAIDQIWYRRSDRYRPVEQITVRLPGHEGNGEVGHKAIILRGHMTVRKGVA